MKRIFAIIVLVATFFVTASALVLRQTQKFCANEAELVLYGGGRVSFYDGETGSFVEGKYDLDWNNHYIFIYEQDGTRAFTGKFTGHNESKSKVYTVTLAGMVMKSCQ